MISLQLRSFSKFTTIVYQKSFQQWVQQEAKRSILQDYEVTHRHIDTHLDTYTHTDCNNPPPTLGLIMLLKIVISGLHSGMCRKSKLRVYKEVKECFECKNESLTWVLSFCSDLDLCEI